MDLSDFMNSLKEEKPPRGVGAPLIALWHDARGDWKQAHEIVQNEKGQAAERVHAYLHRKEGDTTNADYWYRRVHSGRPKGALEEEWESLVKSFLAAKR